MNVIFIDFDGTLTGLQSYSNEDIERRVKILSEICHECNAKVVIEASAKNAIDEETMEIDVESEFVLFLFYLFNKYDIDVIGRTPNVKRYLNNDKCCYKSMWKEDEIRLYLMRHPEIEHYCVIDDDDLTQLNQKSDLDKVRNHLVLVTDWVKGDPSQEGLIPKHKEQVKEILQKENEVARLVRKYKKNYN